MVESEMCKFSWQKAVCDKKRPYEHFVGEPALAALKNNKASCCDKQAR